MRSPSSQARPRQHRPQRQPQRQPQSQPQSQPQGTKLHRQTRPSQLAPTQPASPPATAFRALAASSPSTIMKIIMSSVRQPSRTSWAAMRLGVLATRSPALLAAARELGGAAATGVVVRTG